MHNLHQVQHLLRIFFEDYLQKIPLKEQIQKIFPNWYLIINHYLFVYLGMQKILQKLDMFQLYQSLFLYFQIISFYKAQSLLLRKRLWINLEKYLLFFYQDVVQLTNQNTFESKEGYRLLESCFHTLFHR